MRYCTAAAELLYNKEYRPLPVKQGGKTPINGKWRQADYTYDHGYDGRNIGIACGVGEYPVAAADLDITDESIANEMCEYIVNLVGDTLIRIGDAPKKLLLYRYDKAGVKKRRSVVFDCGLIEFLGDGQQFVAFGMHPSGTEYQWHGESIRDRHAETLLVITEAQREQIISHFESLAEARGFEKKIGRTLDRPRLQDYDPDDPLDRKPSVGLTIDECEELLVNLDPNCNRDDWVKIGAALYHEFEGSEEAFQLWDEWSITSPKYKPDEMEGQWASFGRDYRGEPVTMRTVIKMANDNVADISHLEEPPINGDDDFFGTLNWSVSRFSDNPAPIEMVIDGMLPKGIVSMLYSAGGAGKSTLALYKAVKIAIAGKFHVDFLGHDVSGGKVVILTAEDDDNTTNRRYVNTVMAIAEELGCKYEDIKAEAVKNLMIVNTVGHPVTLFKRKSDGTLTTTKHYKSFLAELKKKQNLQLVFIDTKARFSPAEEVDNAVATQEITYYERMAKETGATIMLLHHTNKVSRDGSTSGAQSFRGATALFDSIRAAWYLRGCTETELMLQGIEDRTPGRYLVWENSKNNYLPVNLPLILERNDFSYTARPMPQRGTPAERKAIKRQGVWGCVEAMLKTSPASQSDIINACEENGIAGKEAVRATLKSMESQGVISKAKGTKNSWVYTLEDEKDDDDDDDRSDDLSAE